MRRILIMAGLAVALAAPATADAASCGSRKTTGTVIGAVGGGLLGNAVGGTTATLLGAGGGALVGREVGKNGCKKRYVAPKRVSSARAAPGYATNASYRGSCRYETRSYYDERGRMVHSPVRVCN